MTIPAQPAPALTLCNERRDFPEWHRGRTHYALWALDVDTAPVRQRVQAAQAHLAPYLLDGYARQPHITVGLCGFPSAAPVHADDFGVQALRAQLAALRQARPEGFGLRLGALDSFSSVPYLGVQADDGHLDTLRRCLAHNAMNATSGPYTPHVTVGLYAGVWPLSELQAQFALLDCAAALPLEVGSIRLLSYAASEIGGPLQTLATYDFASSTLRWSNALPPALQPFASVT